MMRRLGRYLEKVEKSSDERSARGKLKNHDISREFRDNQQYFMQEFVEKLENDFDTNMAMTVVFELQSYINTGIDESLFSHEEVKSLIDLLRSFEAVVGIFDFSLLESTSIPSDIVSLAEARVAAKQVKDWAEADKIRDMLADLGWKMIDEKDGWRIEKGS
jgi:cysteinyl-tRNA synthetase